MVFRFSSGVGSRDFIKVILYDGLELHVTVKWLVRLVNPHILYKK